MEFLTLIVLAILGEAVWETLKMVWQDGKASIDRMGALVISIVIVFGTGIDVISMIGIKMRWSFLGLILTAILISRGATFIHELITKVSNVKGAPIKAHEYNTNLKSEGVTIQNGELIIKNKEGKKVLDSRERYKVDKVEFKGFEQNKNGNITIE